jgi:hypothetical protein
MSTVIYSSLNLKIMKKTLFLFLSCIFFVSIYQAVGQDPYTRLKQAADQSPVIRQEMARVAISESDSRLKVSRKSPVAFRQFDMVDKTGKRLNPDEDVVVNGKNQKAKEFFDKLNEIEREQNTKGYSLRDSKTPLVIDIVTPSSSLDGRVSEMAQKTSALRSERELQTLTATSKQVDGLDLKSFDKYNDAEKSRLAQTRFSVDGSGNIKAAANPKVVVAPPTVVNPKSAAADNRKTLAKNHSGVWSGDKDLTVDPGTKTPSPSTALKIINETSTKDWSFGVMSTFEAGIKASLTRYAKICTFNPQSPGKSMSEFKVSVNASVYGGLFDNNMDLLSGGVEFYAPSDSSKSMSAKAQIQIAGITIMSLNETVTQSKTYGKSTGKSIDKSFAISVPICCGIGFTGKVGVKGSVGLNYNGGIYRTVVSLSADPVVDLKGYVEAGISIGGVANLGVGGELTFIKGDIPLNSFVGIWAQNAEQVVVGYNYYMGFDLSMLSGRLYGYAELCAPIVGCYRLGEVNFFKWGGFKSSGTFAEGGSNYVLANL